LTSRAWAARSISLERPGEVRRNIDGTKEYVRLAHDIGSPGVKVRPNGVPKGDDLDATLRRIGKALHEVGEDAQDYGIEIRVEVHGAITSEYPTSQRSSSTRITPTFTFAGTQTPARSRTGQSARISR